MPKKLVLTFLLLNLAACGESINPYGIHTAAVTSSNQKGPSGTGGALIYNKDNPQPGNCDQHVGDDQEHDD